MPGHNTSNPQHISDADFFAHLLKKHAPFTSQVMIHAIRQYVSFVAHNQAFVLEVYGESMTNPALWVNACLHIKAELERRYPGLIVDTAVDP